MKIAHASAGAGAEINHLHRRAQSFPNWNYAINLVRQRNLWRKLVQSKSDLANVNSVCIRFDSLKVAFRASLQIGESVAVSREDSVFGAHFHGKIAQNQTILQVE